MTPYMKKILGKFPGEITMNAPTPATDNLFKVIDDKDTIPLQEN